MNDFLEKQRRKLLDNIEYDNEEDRLKGLIYKKEIEYKEAQFTIESAIGSIERNTKKLQRRKTDVFATFFYSVMIALILNIINLGGRNAVMAAMRADILLIIIYLIMALNLIRKIYWCLFDFGHDLLPVLPKTKSSLKDDINKLILKKEADELKVLKLKVELDELRKNLNVIQNSDEGEEEMSKTTILMILDGYGLNDKTEGNAVALGKTPVMDGLMKDYPFVKGYASGLAVGLPDGQMGNSEVGHLNMGAGRIVYQELTRITKEIEDGVFFENEALLAAVENCKKNDSALHMYGLLSDGGVHSHNTHLYGLLELAKRSGLSKVYVHCFLDGRDTAPTSGLGFVKELEDEMAKIGVGKIATVTGRYYAMDRDNNYDRVELAYNALTLGEGIKADSAQAAVQQSYDAGENDEFVKPTVVLTDGNPTAVISENDSIIFFNFRPDRAREITRAFCCEDFTGFERKKGFMKLTYVCFTEYDVTIPNKIIAFKKVEINNTLGEYLAAKGLKQLRTAETEKYAHVTFFFNGGKEEPNPGEDRILVKSPAVATYDLKPEMSAYEVCDGLVKAIRGGEYDVIIVNFANPDMVGHTGVQEAAIKAVEAIDECVGRVVDAVKDTGSQLFICADHGNCEQLIDYETGAPFTAHTTNPVPFILVNYDENYKLRENGCLADIAPTLLEMMGLEQPKEMTGKSLLIKK